MKCHALILFLLQLPRAAAQPRIGALSSSGKLSYWTGNTDCLNCLIQAVPVDFDGPQSAGDDIVDFHCVAKANGEVGVLADVPYQIDLPQDFVEEHMIDLQSGLATVCIPGGRAVRFPNSTAPDQVVIPDGANLQVFLSGETPRERSGNRTVLVVRVSGTAESPEESVERLRGAVFGLGSQPLVNSMRAQFGRCSFSKVDFIPATGFDQFEDGVLNIPMKFRLQGRDAFQVLNDATRSVFELLQIDSLQDNFDHVFFCMAKGTSYGRRGNQWLAFGEVAGWRSVFNSEWCGSLTTMMHEVGHNLGLVHSASDLMGEPYGDTTGVMGYSEQTVDGPLKCFNPSKNWLLGWYKDKALDIVDSWTGRLVAFVDYELADPSNNESVLLKIGEFLFVQYNRAKDFNAGTSRHQDEVVAVAGEGALTSSSVLLAGLGAGERYSWKGTTIQVCALGSNPSTSMDYAEVSVFPTGGTSTCTVAPTSPPTSPTLPSAGASLMPNSPPPSFAPTPQPTTRAPALVTAAPFAPSILTHPSVFGAQWVQVGADIDGEARNNFFGSSVALSSNGEILAIGALGNDEVGQNAGHVRVFISAGGWVQLGNDLDGSAAGDSFGFSVALSAEGTILAVGATGVDGINGMDAGRVEVFQWRNSVWQAMGRALDGEAAGDDFGHSVALSDDGLVLAVGAPKNDGGSTLSGRVRVFEWDGAEWNFRGEALDGMLAGNAFGDSVALSSDGSIVACGGKLTNPNYVQVLRWSDSMWTQLGSIITGATSTDNFGESVSLSGNGRVVAVGADNGNYAEIYRYDGTDWFQIGQTIRGVQLRDLFGFSLSLSFDGSTVVIGGHWNDSGGFNAGHVLVYRLAPNGEEWIRVGQEIVGESAGDSFGEAVSISDDGTRIAVGAQYNDGNGAISGHVRVFDLVI